MSTTLQELRNLIFKGGSIVSVSYLALRVINSWLNNMARQKLTVYYGKVIDLTLTILLLNMEHVLYVTNISFGLVVSVSTSHTAGRGFASRPGHTKDHHKNGTNCLPAWHAMR